VVVVEGFGGFDGPEGKIPYAYLPKRPLATGTVETAVKRRRSRIRRRKVTIYFLSNAARRKIRRRIIIRHHARVRFRRPRVYSSDCFSFFENGQISRTYDVCVQPYLGSARHLLRSGNVSI